MLHVPHSLYISNNVLCNVLFKTDMVRCIVLRPGKNMQALCESRRWPENTQLGDNTSVRCRHKSSG